MQASVQGSKVSHGTPNTSHTDILLIYRQSTSHSIRKQTNKNIQLLSH